MGQHCTHAATAFRKIDSHGWVDEMYGDKGEMTCGAACSEHVEMAGTGAGAESAQTHTLQLDVAHSRGLARQVRYDFQEQKRKEYFNLP
jgi:hypothetical protein